MRWSTFATVCVLFMAMETAGIGKVGQEQETDCTSCKDHPLLSRYPQSVIVGHDQKAFDEQRFTTGRVIEKDGEKLAVCLLVDSGKLYRFPFETIRGIHSLEVKARYLRGEMEHLRLREFQPGRCRYVHPQGVGRTA